MSGGFQRTLDHIRSVAGYEAEKGRLFERLMKTYFLEDPLYRERFSDVRLWSEWAAARPDFDGADTGIDLVAEERRGGCCAIQCKCHAPGTQIAKPHLDSFIAASARDPFTARIVVDTGDGWGPNARRTIEHLKPACAVLRFGDLAGRPFDWPDLAHGEPEDLAFRREPFRLRPHQQAAFDDVLAGFRDHDRGKLVMACGAGKTFTALRIAEAVAGAGGRVLYLVPSISLFSQSMREWATQRAVAHRYVGVCSDTRGVPTPIAWRRSSPRLRPATCTSTLTRIVQKCGTTSENVRDFGEKQELKLADEEGRPARWTLIVGDNGVGKSRRFVHSVGPAQGAVRFPRASRACKSAASVSRSVSFAFFKARNDRYRITTPFTVVSRASRAASANPSFPITLSTSTRGSSPITVTIWSFMVSGSSSRASFNGKFSSAPRSRLVFSSRRGTITSMSFVALTCPCNVVATPPPTT